MVTLETVEITKGMPENDPEPTESEIKEDAVEIKGIEKEIEKEIENEIEKKLKKNQNFKK